MNTVGDRPATTQYFALQSVIVSLLGGVAPIIWGVTLDSLSDVQVSIGNTELDGYAIFFGLQVLLLMVVLVALMRVKEATATSTGALLHRIFIGVPSQRLAALASRSGAGK
jgi:hypothetical protein